MPDPATTDLSLFDKDGKLLWVGSRDELRRRLVGSTIKAFPARPNVQSVEEVSSGSSFDAQFTYDVQDIDEDLQEQDQHQDPDAADSQEWVDEPDEQVYSQHNWPRRLGTVLEPPRRFCCPR